MKKTKQELINRLLSKGKGLLNRIDANGVSCIYDDCEKGTWRQQVELCCVSSCPIYDVRPCSREGAIQKSKGQPIPVVQLQEIPPDMQREGHKNEPKSEFRGQRYGIE